jgi:hypothetical protein
MDWNIEDKNLLAWVLQSSSLTQSSNISRKFQEHQEHFMVFGKDLIKTLRNSLTRHVKMKSKH